MSLVRLTALLAAALIGLGAAGCGDSSSDDGDSGPKLSGERGEVKVAVEEFYEDLNDYDAAGVCSRMSPKARKQIADGAVGAAAKSGEPSCERSFGRFLALAKKSGGLKQTATAKVSKVALDGDEAIVTVDFKGQSGEVPMTKIDGEWKMGVTVGSTATSQPAEPAK